MFLLVLAIGIVVIAICVVYWYRNPFSFSVPQSIPSILKESVHHATIPYHKPKKMPPLLLDYNPPFMIEWMPATALPIIGGQYVSSVSMIYYKSSGSHHISMVQFDIVEERLENEQMLAIPVSTLPIRITFEKGYQRIEKSKTNTWSISYVTIVEGIEYESVGAGFGTWFYE